MMRVRRRVAVLMTCGWTWLACGQAGVLDLGFRPQFNDRVRAMLVQADDKILVSGHFTQVNGEARNRIVRLNLDGSIDPTFSFSANEFVHSIVQWTNGHITISGFFTEVNGVARNGLARLNPDGSLVAQFVSDQYYGSLNLALQDDGRVVFGSFKDLIRLNHDGSRDTGFRVSAGQFDTIQCAAIFSNTIAIGGNFKQINGSVEQWRAAKVHTEGYLINSFQTYRENLAPYVLTMLPLEDGSVIVGGAPFARLLPNGRTDPSFLYWGSNYQLVQALSLYHENKIIAGGRFETANGFPANYLIRVDWNGNVDSSFLHSGPDDQVWAIAAQPDGKILIAGAFQNYDGVPQPFISRLLGDEPVMEQRRINENQIELSWPAAYTNFVLQSASSVPATNWIILTNSPVVVSNICYVTNTVTTGNQFFRLVKESPP